MKQTINEVEINGTIYVPKSSLGTQQAVNTDGLPYVIVSCGANGGGIHVGYLKERKGDEVTLVLARRIQYWNGAASISEIAERGVSKPNECRFTAPVGEITLPHVVELIKVTTKAYENIGAVPVWTK